MEQAFVFNWTEYERGWGSRPDGISVHVTEQEALSFVKAHWSALPSDGTPDEYDRPDTNTPFGVVIQDAVFARLLADRKSIRLWARDAKIESHSDGRRVLVISNTKLLLSAGGNAAGATDQVHGEAEKPASPSTSGASAGRDPRFIDLCLTKQASPAEFRTFLARWHEGDGRAYANVWEFLGLSRDEFNTVLADESKAWAVALNHLDRRHQTAGYARRVRGTEPCLVHFTGQYEATLCPMVAFQRLNGDIRFVEKAFFDEHFEPLSDDEAAACATLFQRVVARNPSTWHAWHVKSQGAYLVHFEGRHESTQKDMTAYQGLDGVVWFRDSDIFKDGRFIQLP